MEKLLLSCLLFVAVLGMPRAGICQRGELRGRVLDGQGPAGFQA